MYKHMFKGFLVVAAMGSFAFQASAADVAAVVELAKTTGCYSCHANAEKVVGPSFAAIAERYAGDKDAVATIAQSIQNGSRGKWGRAPMPGHSSLSATDLKLMSEWVLSIKP